jgi:hypothetical protein
MGREAKTPQTEEAHGSRADAPEVERDGDASCVRG